MNTAQVVSDRIAVGGARQVDMEVYRPLEQQPVAALVWLPAPGVPASRYRRFATALADRGVVTALVDGRRQGATRIGHAHNPRVAYRERVEQDAPAALAWLGHDQPEVPLVLGEHSLGGPAAVVAASWAQPAVAGVVVVAAQPVRWRAYPGADRLRQRLSPQLAAEAATAWGYAPGDQPGFDGHQPARLPRHGARRSRSPWWSLHTAHRDYQHALATLELPALVVSIDGEHHDPPSVADRVCAQLPAAYMSRWHHHASRADGDALHHLNWPRRAALPIAAQLAVWIGDLPPRPRPTSPGAGHSRATSTNDDARGPASPSSGAPTVYPLSSLQPPLQRDEPEFEAQPAPGLKPAPERI